MMERYQLWPDTISTVSIPLDETFSGIMVEAVVGLNRGGIAASRVYDDIYHGEFPLTRRFIDECVTPHVVEHYRSLTGSVVEKASIEITAEFVHDPDNLGMLVHQHPKSAFVAVYYLAANPGNQIILDPRGSACRGYPLWFVREHFTPYEHIPKDNELLIVPGYLEHYVVSAPGHYRLALIVDYAFSQTPV